MGSMRNEPGSWNSNSTERNTEIQPNGIYLAAVAQAVNSAPVRTRLRPLPTLPKPGSARSRILKALKHMNNSQNATQWRNASQKKKLSLKRKKRLDDIIEQSWAFLRKTNQILPKSNIPRQSIGFEVSPLVMQSPGADTSSLNRPFIQPEGSRDADALGLRSVYRTSMLVPQIIVKNKRLLQPVVSDDFIAGDEEDDQQFPPWPHSHFVEEEDDDPMDCYINTENEKEPSIYEISSGTSEHPTNSLPAEQRSFSPSNSWDSDSRLRIIESPNMSDSSLKEEGRAMPRLGLEKSYRQHKVKAEHGDSEPAAVFTINQPVLKNIGEPDETRSLTIAPQHLSISQPCLLSNNRGNELSSDSFESENDEDRVPALSRPFPGAVPEHFITAVDHEFAAAGANFSQSSHGKDTRTPGLRNESETDDDRVTRPFPSAIPEHFTTAVNHGIVSADNSVPQSSHGDGPTIAGLLGEQEFPSAITQCLQSGVTFSSSCGQNEAPSMTTSHTKCQNDVVSSSSSLREPTADCASAETSHHTHKDLPESPVDKSALSNSSAACHSGVKPLSSTSELLHEVLCIPTSNHELQVRTSDDDGGEKGESSLSGVEMAPDNQRIPVATVGCCGSRENYATPAEQELSSTKTNSCHNSTVPASKDSQRVSKTLLTSGVRQFEESFQIPGCSKSMSGNGGRRDLGRVGSGTAAESNGTDDLDEDLLFMQSMIPALKRIEPKERFEIKMKIMRTIYNATYRSQDTG